VRLGKPERVLDQLRAVVSETVDAPYIAAMVSHAAALEANDPAALEAAAAQFRAQGARLLAAEAMAQAAAALYATGDQVAGTRAATVSMRWQAECGDVSTPALLSRPAALSVREFEVADLVAQGLSSRDAAERLFVSVRTVDNHLRRVYQKLDLDDREQLAEFWNVSGAS
jgi:DNA-binding CsgD family transcriptional regulator